MARWAIPSPRVECVELKCPHRQQDGELALQNEPACWNDAPERLPTARHHETVITDFDGTDTATCQTGEIAMHIDVVEKWYNVECMAVI